MKRLLAILLILIAFNMSSCNECTNCEPFTEEPFLKIRFFNEADSTKRIIIIDSVNQLLVTDFRHFRDTTNEFKFPLDMHHDTSVYQMVYRDTSDLETYLNNEITLIYNRQFIRRDDNYILVECNLESFNTNFAKYKLICKDSSINECLSNEAVASIYN